MLLIGLRTTLLAEGALLVFGVQAVVHYVLRVHLLVIKQDELWMHLRRSRTPLKPQHSVLHSALHLVGGTEDSDAMPRLSHLGLTSARPDVMLKDRVAGSWPFHAHQELPPRRHLGHVEAHRMPERHTAVEHAIHLAATGQLSVLGVLMCLAGGVRKVEALAVAAPSSLGQIDIEAILQDRLQAAMHCTVEQVALVLVNIASNRSTRLVLL